MFFVFMYLLMAFIFFLFFNPTVLEDKDIKKYNSPVFIQILNLAVSLFWFPIVLYYLFKE